MRGVKYKQLPAKLHRWFISYEDKKGRYVEENFDLKREALYRSGQLWRTQNIEAQLWTRERALPASSLRRKPK